MLPPSWRDGRISKDARVERTFKKAELSEGGRTDGRTGQRKGRQAASDQTSEIKSRRHGEMGRREEKPGGAMSHESELTMGLPEIEGEGTGLGPSSLVLPCSS